MCTDAGLAGQRPQPDRPERIAVTTAGDAAAFVVTVGQAGPTAASGVWYGPLAGRPGRISGLIPDTNLAFAPDDRALAAAVQDETGSMVIVLDPALEPGEWRQFRLPGFAEALTWTPGRPGGAGRGAGCRRGVAHLGPPAERPGR